MTQKTENWSSSWNSSTDPSKQRKYRENAPLHVKDKLVSVNLDKELRNELGTRNLNLRTGDRVKIMRGDEKGSKGIVNRIDREELKVYINGVEVERQDGSTNQKPFPPSNLQIIGLNTEDMSRIEKYEVEDVQDIKVEEEEVEEALEEDEENEMMQQMQGGESGAHEQYEEDEEETEEEEAEETKESEAETEEDSDTESAGETDYEEIVSGTIDEAKQKVEELDEPEFDKLIEAEEANKDRKTLKEHFESQKEE
ncbi:MAG: 50S ribosomal protein L24 [Candidatus Nanohaloarchaea archaeon]